MLNGYHAHADSANGFGRKLSDGRSPIATLSNLGNTCFLNSVVYTLRFAPNFLHNLHHLVADLALADRKLGQAKAKSSSLGRNLATFANSNSRSWSSKDLLSLTAANGDEQCKSKIRLAAEKMHEMYASLRAAEAPGGVGDPHQADAFLAALRNVNPIFEGNQQQDAHELLMCLLDSIRETCRSLRRKFERHSSDARAPEPRGADDAGDALACAKPSLGMLRKSWKNRKKAKSSKPESPTKENDDHHPHHQDDEPDDWGKRLGCDFVAEDFEGTTVLRTTCLECEIVTERKQTMCDISVPIPEEGKTSDAKEPSAVYQQACVTSEYLRDQNKYWCDECVRYNEARRSVTYETLPRLLVLQLKRFSGGMKKLTSHMPTPLDLACFCDACCRLPATERPHRYALYGVIMHLGQTLTGGHYIAYIKAQYAGAADPYACCERDDKACLVANANEKPNFMKNLFARSKNNGASDKRRAFNPVQPTQTDAAPGVAAICSSVDCCGVKLNRNIWNYEDQASCDRDVWLMCDDETVKIVSNEEFDELLSSKPKIRSTSTPYLLFYVKADSEQ